MTANIATMKDPRYTQLAQLLVKHSMQVKPKDKVLIEAFDIPADFTTELIRAVAGVGGLPVVSTYTQPVMREIRNVVGNRGLFLI